LSQGLNFVPGGRSGTGKMWETTNPSSIRQVSESRLRAPGRNPPAHRDKAAMNGAQLFKGQDKSSGPMSGPPARSASLSAYRENNKCRKNLSQGLNFVPGGRSGTGKMWETTNPSSIRQVSESRLRAPGRNPPAHRDKAAMNGAQLFMVHSNSSGLMSGPPAWRCTIFSATATLMN
jgi:hypothetical protein